ncbi:uncharacterized protein MELLADRAFT_103727 [Melampsora larici-populina 98AG31]|uniref:Uncharacterized protein n=1 Tax=Melampsora larici-populina (strain 98AG31 / pathotype 3-4-7) TaxID=747676 RepID=F4RC66_MELLP|nr:uncharacterized protein MELLADRAFT_103727 [Melampsora larici-populina 98AG31]EGG10003.1 hypothetical protein MELLADRAFT_103727 [Melampsora larici-populina 98AG31]
MSDRRIFSTVPTLIDCVPSQQLDVFKSLCRTDLENHGLSQLTFDWGMPDRDPWNQTMAIFIVKHWQYARLQGAFDKQSITPEHKTEENCLGIMLRWVRGQRVDIRQNCRSAQKNLQKEMRRKKRTLFKYRVESLSRLLRASNLPDQAAELLPHHDCCSETEWVPEETSYPSIGLVWRSQQYNSIIQQIDGLSFKYCSSTQGPLRASRRFDQCRTKATQVDSNAAFCPGLPENCYDPLFLFNLTDEEKAALQMKPVSSLLNTLPNVIQNFSISLVFKSGSTRYSFFFTNRYVAGN